MEITVSQQQGQVPVTVFHLQGDIDGSNSEQIQTAIDQAVADGTHDIILDLSKVPYMSSAGMRLLNSVFNQLRGNLPQESDAAMNKGIRNGTFKSPHLKLVKPTARVLDVLKMTGIDMFLEVHQSVPDAVASF